MRDNPIHTESSGQTRLAYILGVPLAENAVRQWPQMEEVVRGRELIGAVEGNFEAVTLEVGRRLRLENIIVVEWSINYGDDRIYRNVDDWRDRGWKGDSGDGLLGRARRNTYLEKRHDGPPRDA